MLIGKNLFVRLIDFHKIYIKEKDIILFHSIVLKRVHLFLKCVHRFVK